MGKKLKWRWRIGLFFLRRNEIVQTIMAWLNGKKTNIIGVMMILHAVVITGWQEGNWTLAQAEILAGLAMITGRAALAKGPTKENKE